MKSQKCWEEVKNVGGTTIEEQMLNYEKIFEPWDPKDPIRLNLERQLRIMERTIDRITEANTILALQRVIIVYNANEFRLRDNPTGEEFEDIVCDFQKWEMRVANHIEGGEVSKKLFLEKVAEVFSRARVRFKALKT